MKYLITGGCGFIGSNLAAEVLKRNEELVIFDNLFRFGSSSNLKWLKSKGTFKYYLNDIRNLNDVEKVIREEKPNVIFHLAGQVAMTTSIENPRLDFEINSIGTFNLLDSVRKYSPNTMVLYSSTNKVYGDFNYLDFEEKNKRYFNKLYPNGFSEKLTLNFQSPYGCSKGCADQYLLDFNRIYNLKTVVFRHSTMYGGNQHASYDQGWIGWFIQKALEIKNNLNIQPFTISGNGKQVRDVLHADDVTNLYFMSVNKINKIAGEEFNIGGGIKNSLSLLELFNLLEEILNIKMNYKKIKWRESDQKVFIADNVKINKLVGWKPKVSPRNGIVKMISWLENEMQKK